MGLMGLPRERSPHARGCWAVNLHGSFPLGSRSLLSEINGQQRGTRLLDYHVVHMIEIGEAENMESQERGTLTKGKKMSKS